MKPLALLAGHVFGSNNLEYSNSEIYFPKPKIAKVYKDHLRVSDLLYSRQYAEQIANHKQFKQYAFTNRKHSAQGMPLLPCCAD